MLENASLLYLIAGLGTINGFVFGIYLLFSNIGKKQANIYLGIFLILLSIRFFRSLHYYYNGIDYPVFLIGHTAFLLAVPFIYFYYRASFTENASLRLNDLIHLLPLSALAIHQFYCLNVVSFSILIIYCLLAHRILYLFLRDKKGKTSLKFHNFYWYQNLLFLIYLNGLFYILNVTFNFLPYILGAVSYSLIFYLMLFYWIRHQQYQKQRKILKKYTNSALTDSEANKYKQDLFDKIKTEKLYTDPTLTLKNLLSYFQYLTTS